MAEVESHSDQRTNSGCKNALVKEKLVLVVGMWIVFHEIERQDEDQAVGRLAVDGKEWVGLMLHSDYWVLRSSSS